MPLDDMAQERRQASRQDRGGFASIFIPAIIILRVRVLPIRGKGLAHLSLENTYMF